MWPTFYIPGLARYIETFVPGDVKYACGQFTTNTTPVSIPNPTGIADGDTQLLIVTWFTSGSIVWPSGWRIAFDAARCALPQGSTSFGLGNQRVYVREYQAGDPDFSVYVTGGGLVSVLYANVILQNPEASDPWLNACWNWQNASAYGGYAPEGPMQYLEVANEGDLIVQCTSPVTALTAANEPDSSDVEFACTGEIVLAATPRTGHSMAGVYGRRLANNLLTHTVDFDPSGWTAVGMTRDTTAAYTSSAKAYVQIAPTATNNNHYFEQSVTLEAGEAYLFSVRYFGNSGSNAYAWLSYEKPDTTEHGAGCIAAGNIQANMSGSTEITWASGKSRRTQETGNLLGVFGAIQSILITPDTTGTYKLRLHVTNGTDPNTAHVGDPNDWLQVAGVSLVKGPLKNAMPIFLPTTSSPILPGDAPYVVPTPPTLGNSTTNKGYTNFIMRRSGGTRPLCKLFNNVTRGVYSEFGDNTITDSRVRGSPEAEGDIAIRTSHVVYDLLATKKFYFELYVNSFGTGSANDCYVIGACPFESANVTVPNTATNTATGDYPHQFAYTALGKTYTNGTLDVGTVTGWSIGDYIGCGINLTDWEITFYRNGTLLKTMTIPAGALREAFWVGLFGFYAAYSADKQARFTYNFRGPFGGRKPSGFSAFDFDNEQT